MVNIAETLDRFGMPPLVRAITAGRIRWMRLLT